MVSLLLPLKFFYDPIALPTIAGYFASLFFKILIKSWQNKKFTYKAFLKDGGMPSSHTAFVSSITTAIFLNQGTSPLFWLAVVFSLVVMRDAVSVRFETGRQGKAINQIVSKLSLKGEISGKELKELVGHTPFQVVVGLIVGILVSTWTYMVLFA